MKKFFSLFIAIFIIFSLTGCGQNNIDNESIDKTITHIEADELENALTVCQTMNEKTLEKGSNKIIVCIVEKLDYYLNFNNWINTKYVLIHSDAINKLKIYKKILSFFVSEDTFTNADTFVSTALQLEKYTIWNEYHASDDDYLSEAQNYMNQGAPYRNTSWSTAVLYYKKAYTVANNAYNHFKDNNNKGMKEAADFYKAYTTLISNLINEKETTAAEENAYNKAVALYKTMVQDYINAISEILEITKSFPSKLY